MAEVPWPLLTGMEPVTPLADHPLRPARRRRPQPPDGYPVAPSHPRPCHGLPLLGAERGAQGGKGGIALLPKRGNGHSLIAASAQSESRDPGSVMHEELCQCCGKHRMVGCGDAGALDGHVIAQTPPWHAGLGTPGFDAAPCPKSALSPGHGLAIVVVPATRREASRRRRPLPPAP